MASVGITKNGHFCQLVFSQIEEPGSTMKLAHLCWESYTVHIHRTRTRNRMEMRDFGAESLGI